MNHSYGGLWSVIHARVEHLADSPLAPLGGNAELSRIELLPLASLGENKEFEPIPLRGTAQLRIILVLLDQGLLTEIATASV
jgi:hypothetical protein